MTKLTMTVFACLFASMLLACACGAATQSHSCSIPGGYTNWTDYLSVPQFDSSLGTLNSVTIDLDGHIAGVAKLESLDQDSSEISTTITGTVVVSGLGSVSSVSASPVASLTQSVTAYDGVLDWGGTSGATLGYSANASNSALLTAPGDLANFIGTGLVSLPVAGSGKSKAMGPGNFRAEITTQASANVTVIYDYAVPEPSSLLGLGSCLLGAGGFLLRRRR